MNELEYDKEKIRSVHTDKLNNPRDDQENARRSGHLRK